MIRSRARSARARLALAGCALWLVGVEGMPAVHQAMHDRLAPHRHDHDSIVTVSLEDTTHRHPDGTIHYVTPGSRAPGKSPRRELPCGRGVRAGDPAGHANGLAHHAAALAPAPPPITEPLPVDRRPIAVVVARTIELVAHDPLTATARGPPTLA